MAFLERLHHALDSPETPSEEPDAVNRLRDALVAEHGSALKRILTRPGQDSVLVVVSLPPERIAEEEVRLAAMSDLPSTSSTKQRTRSCFGWPNRALSPCRH